MSGKAWFKQDTSLIFNPTVQSLDAETYRVFMYLQTMLSVKRTDKLAEADFVPVAPVRSWRVYVKKLAEVGLVEWDREAQTIACPKFTELNSTWVSGKVVRKPVKVLPADQVYSYNPDYVSPVW